MILYSEKDDHYSHRVRIVLAEKDIACEIRETSNEEAPDEVLALNPYHCLPILSDRDLGLYNTGVMLEYLDERFPHPPLLPVYPVSRANSRSLMLRIDKEWCPLIDALTLKELSEKELLIMREELLNEISTVAPTFKEFNFFMSEDFSIIDCYLAPILWRLPSLGINLPLNRHLKPLLDYQAKIFARQSFQDSLSMIERDLRSLGLYDTGVMLEYLDERFPHPPLLPVYPVSRANSRSLMLRIDKEWCPLIDALTLKELSEKELLIMREELLNEISTVAPTFKEFNFFMSEDFSIIDCYLAPILWRLPSLGINLPLNRHLKPLLDYQAKIFARQSFQDSLSMIERDLRS